MKRLLSLLFCLGAFAAFAAGPTTQPVNTAAQTLGNLTARTVNLGATGDRASITIPSYVTAYQVTAAKITNCSTTPVLATVGLWTGESATGTNIVVAATITGASAASVVLSSTLASTARLTAGTIFINSTIANAAALVCDFHITIDDLS